MPCNHKPQSDRMPRTCSHRREPALQSALQAGLPISPVQFAAKGYSQFGADGVIWAILFALDSLRGGYYVEFGVQDGCERNTRWLAERCGWNGLLLDGSHADASLNLHRALVTAATISQTFARNSVPRAPDLISIDVNDQDWHVWRSLAGAGYRPKVVVVEYSWDKGLWPADLVPPLREASIAGPWKLLPCRHGCQAGPPLHGTPRLGDPNRTNVFGATAVAFERLGHALGYSLVAVLMPDVYFVRDDLLGSPARFARTGQELLRSSPSTALALTCRATLACNGFTSSAEALLVQNGSELSQHS